MDATERLASDKNCLTSLMDAAERLASNKNCFTSLMDATEIILVSQARCVTSQMEATHGDWLLKKIVTDDQGSCQSASCIITAGRGYVWTYKTGSVVTTASCKSKRIPCEMKELAVKLTEVTAQSLRICSAQLLKGSYRPECRGRELILLQYPQDIIFWSLRVSLPLTGAWLYTLLWIGKDGQPCVFEEHLYLSFIPRAPTGTPLSLVHSSGIHRLTGQLVGCLKLHYCRVAADLAVVLRVPSVVASEMLAAAANQTIDIARPVNRHVGLGGILAAVDRHVCHHTWAAAAVEKHNESRGN
ncbi:hypothetical protein RRG08_018546 [Elysia crispata]|uniref:Uncharacterized protein n=1 Tax=Elysia crispata TaxID=231223 RepID=A0AAE1APK2_9GAST|nr:hypothetical protein RRG08_018546 [Elysia crispata]